MPSPLMLGNKFDIVEGFPTVDLQTAANNGDYVSMKNASAIGIVFTSGVGTASDDPTVTIQQAQDNAGTGVKALNVVTSPVQVWKKQAATDLSAVTVWTDASGDASTNTVTNATGAEQALIWVIEFKAEDLDVDNAFNHLRATIADIGSNAQPGSLMYIIEPMYPASPDSVLSAL